MKDVKCPRCHINMEKRKEIEPNEPDEKGNISLVLSYHYFWYCILCERRYQVEITNE